MTFDSVILAAVAAELKSRLVSGRANGVHQPSPLDVVLTIRKNRISRRLLISAEAQSPRIHLTAAKRPNPKTPPNFCAILRKYLDGALLTGVEQMDFDRILHLKFAAYDGEMFTLIAEIMGKHSNVVLVNAAGRILGTIKPVGRSKSRYREVLPGRQYVSPPAQDRANPLGITEEGFDRLLADTFSDLSGMSGSEIADWLAKTFTGVSPFAARELVERSGADFVQLGRACAEFFGGVRSGEFSPVLITDDLGRSTGFYAFQSVQHAAPNQHQRSSISAVADMYYMSVLPVRAFESAKAEFVSHLRKELKSREEAVTAIREKMAECEGAERLKQIGELILAQTAAVREGASLVTLVDYYDPNSAAIEVKLEPQLSASENAEAYFKKYRKAVSGSEALPDRLSETNVEIALLRKVLDSAGSITSEDQVGSLLRVLESQGIRTRRQERAAVEKRKAEFDGHKIARVVLDGWEILVGQNSEANDYLLARAAKPTDIWVHVKASPSAHVIIRTNGKPEAVPKSVLYGAAELAVKHSDSKHSSLVPVDYTLRKYVRKVKGAPAGKALYQNEKTIFVTP